jgi:16S rRNA (adenine1518-N6/adenine1519-N6)-dimethyltransferase
MRLNEGAPPGRRARRRWGQNFLVNARAAEAIVRIFGPRSDDVVLEVGPGGGALTALLVGRARRIAAVEIDPRLAAALRARFAPESAAGTIAIIEGDILAMDLPSLLAGAGATPERRARVIGNLPFNIASAVILRLIEERRLIADLLVMVQREVAERILSPPGRKSYGGLSVICQAHASGESVLRLRPGSFRPAPRVESEVVRLTLHEPRGPGAPDPQGLSDLLRAAFRHRRKTLLNNLSRLPGPAGPAADALIRRAGLDPGCRAEEVTVAGFLALLQEWRDAIIRA